eukprot:9501849-Pyramimonas_sp.AAC.1
MVLDFGWQKGRFTNKSAGCNLFLRKRVFRRSHIQQTYEPPSDLAGRAGGVRLRNNSFYIFAIVAYFPPSQRMQ